MNENLLCECRNCSNQVSREAEECPNCEEMEPIGQKKGTRRKRGTNIGLYSIS